jgi:hypothetical protein
MCIFSQPVISVNNTQIFARRTASNTQHLVYQMNYESAHRNAMILPIPVRQPVFDKRLRFIDLSHYETFFDDLAKGFPFRAPISFSCGETTFDAALAHDLKVFNVGNYIASFVPTIADFSRLDDRFTLPAATWNKVPQYRNYGFAVFQLAEGSLRPHPMAFDFETDSNHIFFPTVHIHDGEVHSSEDFDHVLYLQHAGFDSRVSGYINCDATDRTTGLIRSEHTAADFCKIDDARGIVAGDLLVHRMNIRGNHANQDTEIQVSGHPTIPAFNWRPWVFPSAWVAFLGAVCWFFARRHRIKRQKRAEQLAAGAKPDEPTKVSGHQPPPHSLPAAQSGNSGSG